tara:strand:- start:1650 stop:2897 length:1248 start_codon:yes stop_codon:yes gene_type:complete
MVQRVNYHQFSGNTFTLGTGNSRVVMGADSGNLKIQDSQSNTSIIEAGLGLQGITASSVISNASNLALPPSSITNGSLYFATNNNTLYMKAGGGWYKVTTVNTSPSISLDVTSATISDHLNLDITYTVTEPEGTPTTVAITDDITDSAVTVTHTTSNNHVRFAFDGSTAQSSKTITFTATDGVNTGVATCSVSASYTEELHQPSGTTRLLGLSFNSGGMGKVGSWGTPSSSGSITYNNTGGTLNSGYGSNWSSGTYLAPSELSATQSNRNKTFIAWYKGTQSNGTNSVYSPGVPIFGDDTGSVHLGFGLEDGKIVICGGSSATKGTTSLNDGNWRMLAFTCTTGDIAEAYCDASGTMTKEISNKNIATSYNKVYRIGTGYPYSGMDFPTALDAIQIYQGILTQAQLQAIYDKGTT